MGLVPVVTEYTSAREQIEDGVDGLVFDNNEEALYEGLKKVINNPKIIEELKENVVKSDYGNEKEISEFDKLAEKLM
jgi:glycosyltransferase involved in cell wall biosynthesis